MTVLTMVTDAFKPIALPFRVVAVKLPAVEKVAPALAMSVLAIWKTRTASASVIH
jgi:hypothetical protein